MKPSNERDVRASKAGVWLLIVVSLVSLVFGGINFAKRKSSEHIPLNLSAINSVSPNAVNFKMSGIDFSVPEYYIDTISEPESIAQRSVLIFANMPDLTPRIEEKRDISLSFDNVQRQFSLLLQDLHKHPNDLEGIYRLKMNEENEPEHKGFLYGLKYDQPTNSNKVSSLKELYTELSDSDQMLSFIQCDPASRGRYPGCSHKFVYEDILVAIDYRKKYLTQWKETQEKTIALINSFRTQHNNIAKD